MQKRSWTFLTNHGHVFAYLAKYPHSTTRQIATAVGITERAVQNVIRDLVAESYVIRKKLGEIIFTK
jgi:predicted transcriptional regulator